VYHDGEVDLAGTIVGVVDKADILDGSAIAEGDLVFGLRSSGLHTNGYSLARRALAGLDLHATPPGFTTSLGEALLAVHRPYLAEVTALWDAGLRPTGLVHITGGGFVDNPPRILDERLAYALDLHAWEWPLLFRLIQERGSVPELEMARVLNLGIGLLVILREADADAARAILPELVPLGAIVSRPAGEAQVLFEPRSQ
jgi:phosphoribosylformylglycinamidine cyclo-ligase